MVFLCLQSVNYYFNLEHCTRNCSVFPEKNLKSCENLSFPTIEDDKTSPPKDSDLSKISKFITLVVRIDGITRFLVTIASDDATRLQAPSAKRKRYAQDHFELTAALDFMYLLRGGMPSTDPIS